MSILLTGDESPGSLAAVRALHSAGHEVWLAVSHPNTYAARSRRVAGVFHVTEPVVDLERHASEVAAAAARCGVRVVLPATEGSLRALTGREHLFAPGVIVGTCPREILDTATDKARLDSMAREAGLDAPGALPLTAELLDRPDLELPALAKPIRTVEEHGTGLRFREVVRIPDRDALRSLLQRAAGGEWFLQPIVGGELSAVCGVAWRGEVITAVHQVSRRIWPPGEGTSSYALTVPPDRARDAGVGRLIEAIGWSGIFGVQFLRQDARNWVIDLNPRVYGSLALAIAAGPNLPAIWVDLLLGRDRHPVDGYRVGARYRLEEHDLLAIARGVRAGAPPAEALRALLPHRHTVHGVFALRDPMPITATLVKLRQRALRR